MAGFTDKSIDEQDQAEYLGILGLAPAETVKAFVDDIAPELGPVEVVSVQTGLLRFAQEASADRADCAVATDALTLPADDVLVTEAHVLLGSLVDGYSAVFGGDALHAVAVATLDAALRAEAATHAQAALRQRIEEFIEAQAALLAEADEATYSQADLLPA